jgi:hypothetical protein
MSCRKRDTWFNIVRIVKGEEYVCLWQNAFCLKLQVNMENTLFMPTMVPVSSSLQVLKDVIEFIFLYTRMGKELLKELQYLKDRIKNSDYFHVETKKN